MGNTLLIINARLVTVHCLSHLSFFSLRNDVWFGFCALATWNMWLTSNYYSDDFKLPSLWIWAFLWLYCFQYASIHVKAVQCPWSSNKGQNSQVSLFSFIPSLTISFFIFLWLSHSKACAHPATMANNCRRLCRSGELHNVSCWSCSR